LILTVGWHNNSWLRRLSKSSTVGYYKYVIQLGIPLYHRSNIWYIIVIFYLKAQISDVSNSPRVSFIIYDLWVMTIENVTVSVNLYNDTVTSM